MNSVHSNTLETEMIPEVDQTLESQSVHPRLSFSSITSIASQTTLPIQDYSILMSDSKFTTVAPVDYGEIELKEEELKELYTEEELNQLKDTYILKATNEFKIRLEDPTPYLYKESGNISKSGLKAMDCTIVDKQRLQQKQVILETINRPYHPLLYTSFSLTD